MKRKPWITTGRQLAAAIADEYERHPETWGQGQSAAMPNGDPQDTLSPQATRFCPHGALFRAVATGAATHSAGIACARLFGLFDTSLKPTWNDAPGRTVSEVVAKLREIAAS